jgi:hypothetical protein
VGHILADGEYWEWEHAQPYYDVHVVDGVFMALNNDGRLHPQALFPNVEGFHFYDTRMSEYIRAAGFDIKVLPHLVNHKASKKVLPTESRVNAL